MINPLKLGDYILVSEYHSKDNTYILMSMNYKIIQDEDAVKDFIKWLPDLKDNEIYYLSLFARRKYCPDLIKSNNKEQLRRFTATKENMLDKIRQLEIPLGCWKSGQTQAPQEALALYIMPNPRCMKKANEMMGKKCWDLTKSNNFNLHKEAMSCIQQSESYSHVVDFDIDTKDIDLTKLHDIFRTIETLPPCFEILETKGGYHILVYPRLATSYAENYKTDTSEEKYPIKWYKAMQETFPIDRSTHQLLPFAGCCQGGFIPKFITV